MSAVTRPPRELVPRLDRHASVKLCGLGGVGTLVARSGARFLASLDGDVRLVLVDGDSFEASNASRMQFVQYGNKATVVREELLPFFADSRLSLVAIEQYVRPDNLEQLIHEGDIVILAVDNHATRKLVGEYCARLGDVCLISGGNDGVGSDSAGTVRRGTYGNCQIHLRRDGVDLTPALTRFHPEIANPTDAPPEQQDCLSQAASATQILFANHMAASCILNALFLYLCDALHYGELCFDIADGLMRPVPLPVGLPVGLPEGATTIEPPAARR